MKTTPFRNDNQYYLQELQSKLLDYPLSEESFFVDIADSLNPSKSEISALLEITSTYNFGFYRLLDEGKSSKKAVHNIGLLLGLKDLDRNICADEDKLTSIKVKPSNGERSYIPYSNRKLSWHTDGYYNKPQNTINGMLLHCAHPAMEGGENLLLDTEIAFILMHNENPDYITAFMQPDAMTIPANIINGEVIRKEQTGPVFSLTTKDTFGKSTSLHMRYSARTRNIKWKNNPDTLNAVRFLRDLWESDSPYILKYALKLGEGLACNNILHSRTAFRDSEQQELKRLLYRGRYYNRIIAS